MSDQEQTEKQNPVALAAPPKDKRETASTAIAAAAQASIQMRSFMAIERPRNMLQVRDAILAECRLPGFAESAIYRKPVGKKKNDETGRWEEQFVEGLSVRYAESALRNFKNLYSSITAIFDDEDKALVRVTVMDLEGNATIETDVTITKTVERRELKKNQVPLATRKNSYGDTVYLLPATSDEVTIKTNAAVSKALRNAVLRLLPADLRDESEATCRETMAKKDAEDPKAATKKLFDSFSSIGVKPAQLHEYLGHQNDLQPSELTELRGIFLAIKTQETTWRDVMATKSPEEVDAEGNPVVNKQAQKTADVIQRAKERVANKTKPKEDKPTVVETAGEATPETKTEEPASTPPATQPRMREPGED